MADKFHDLRQTHLPFHSIDPRSLLLHQNAAAAAAPIPLRLTAETFSMERGPRYRAYAELREAKLRFRNAVYRDVEPPEKSPPPAKKQVRFVGMETARKRPAAAAVAQSVPDFSAVLRKENRRPPPGLSPVMETKTPPGKNGIGGMVSANSRGSKSASAAGEKRGGGLAAARKSYAGFEELKGFSTAAANAINGESRRGGVRRGKTVLGVRQI